MERNVKKFAWIPKKVEDQLIWLSYYISIQKEEKIEDYYCHDCTNPSTPCGGHVGIYYVWTEIDRKTA